MLGMFSSEAQDTWVAFTMTVKDTKHKLQIVLANCFLCDAGHDPKLCEVHAVTDVCDSCRTGRVQHQSAHGKGNQLAAGAERGSDEAAAGGGC